MNVILQTLHNHVTLLEPTFNQFIDLITSTVVLYTPVVLFQSNLLSRTPYAQEAAYDLSCSFIQAISNFL